MPEDKSNETTTSEAAPIQTPFCGQLRSKKYFMLDRLATSPKTSSTLPITFGAVKRRK